MPDARRFHPRARRLLPIWQQAQRAEQQALAAWGRLQQQQLQELQQQQQLEGYAGDYRQQLAAPGAAALSGANVQNLLGFLSQVEQAANRQAEQLAQLDDRIRRARDFYLGLKAKSDSLARLMDKLDQEFHSQAAQAEQRQADEWSTRQACQPVRR
ncbi:flagellar export protein FliJ [Oceanobacter antarcticus]|uniref:Flagellar FliJ protein n=1 Tax=Oceanobacter antarcticus TaxID=3133425 RepID=A0ABW8NIC0_9GAMM